MNSGVRPAHWVISLGLHVVVIAFLVLLWPRPTALEPISIHLSAPAQTSESSSTASKLPSAPLAPLPKGLKAVNVPRPEWKPLARPVEPTEPPPPTESFQTADELLGTSTPKHRQRSSPSLGWETGGLLAPSQLPPTPPREWVPSGEVHWNLRLTIPAEGGQAIKIDGLDSAHPELDAWLANWLERQVFPASDQHKAYQIDWTLTLRAVLPQ